MDFVNVSGTFVIQSVVFCLFISVTVYIVRKFVEYFPNIFTNKKFDHFWRELFLPTFPIFIGLIFGSIVISYPYPVPFADGQAGRIFFGAGCGFVSGWVYRIVKNYFLKLVNTTSVPDIKDLPEEKSKE